MKSLNKNRTDTENKIWESITGKSEDKINISEIARSTGISRTTLWRKYIFGDMTVKELEQLQLYIRSSNSENVAEIINTL